MMKTGVVRRPWSTKEQKYLIENAGKVSAYAMAEMMGRTVSAIRMRALENNLSMACNTSFNAWQSWEVRAVKAAILNGYGARDLEGYLPRHPISGIVARFYSERKLIEGSLHEK